MRSKPTSSRSSLARWAGAGIALLACLAPTLARAEPPVVPDTIAQRAVACTVCHGKEGRATNQGYFPRIAGKPEGYLFNQLVNFREGRRNYPLMTYLVDQLTDEYLMELAQYFSAVDLPYPPPQTANAPEALLTRGRALALQGDAQRQIPACAQCHGTALTGVRPFIPGLVGLPRDYVVGQLGAWRTGVRHAASPDCMAQVAQKLTPEDIGAVSTWLSSQPVPANAHAADRLPGPLPMKCGGLQDQTTAIKP